MGSRKTHDGADKVYAAAQRWVDRALRSDDSLFTPGVKIWSSRWLGKLREKFLDQPEVGEGSFYDKLKTQLEGSPPEVYQLMGEVLYVHFLIVWPTDIGGDTKKDRISQVLGWSEQNPEVPADLVAALSTGIARIGQARARFFPFHVGFVIEFVERWKELEPDKGTSLLEKPWEFKQFATSLELQGKLFGEAPNAHRVQLEALLHLVFPCTFEGTVSVQQKESIAGAKAFAHFVTERTDDVDREIQQIRRGLKTWLGRDFDFYDRGVGERDIRIQWDPRLRNWDEFVKLAKEYMDSGRLQAEEIDYKLQMNEDLTSARNAVLAGRDDWHNLLKYALRSRSGHPVAWTLLSDFNKWCLDHSEEASSALQVLWSQDPTPVAERIRAFSSRFPRSAVRGAIGNRTNVISVLLMGMDVEQFPPYRVGVFNEAYDRTQYGRPGSDADEAAVYEHALGFLDRFIDEAAERELELRHRLDAQSFVWQIQYIKADEPQEGDSQSKVSNLRVLAEELHLPTDFLQNIETLLYDKKQLIFQGPPGTGKTYVAQKLANHLAGSPERVSLVQFHPSYAYEDFVQGFRPTTLEDGQPGFKLTDGPLVRAAKKAENDSHNHFLIIDEINRGQIAKVFGELYFLLEYRDETITLQYQQEMTFSLPKNLYIIGTMNTADRSIALVDLALRRRFYFVDFHPDDEPIEGVLRRWLADRAPGMEWVADIVARANELLQEDRDAAIGPSYFMKDGLDAETVKRIWAHSVRPYVAELLHSQPDRLDDFDLNRLRGSTHPSSPEPQPSDEAQASDGSEGQGASVSDAQD